MRIEKLSIVFIVACMILSFALRIFPMFDLQNLGNVCGVDSWYNIRLVETFLETHDFVNFEVFTLFPLGQNIAWGSLFTVMSSLFPIISGAVTRVEIINAVSLFVPFLFVFIVPIGYVIGKKVGDWKTGLLSALFVAIIGGQFFARSLYGYYDHHVAEMLFSSLFCMGYVLAISNKNKMILFGVLAGISYLLGLLTMTTLVVFGLFVSVYTLIQFIVNFKQGKDSIQLAILNTIVFGIASLGLIINGFSISFTLYDYSLGLLLVNALPIAGSWALYGLSKLLKDKNVYWYLGSIAVLFIGFVLTLKFAFSDIWNMMYQNIISHLASSNPYILEAHGWTFETAVLSFGFGLLLAILGFVLMFKHVLSKPQCLFMIIWSIGALILTCAQVRWEYFLGLNIAILSAFCISEVINICKKSKPDKMLNGILAGVLIIGVAFTGLSIYQDVEISINFKEYCSTSEDWIDACEWLESNTPDVGLNYYTIYNEENFAYPDEAYGILAWWDYGHYITTIGKRIPLSNPFQAGVTGEYGVASILTETNMSVVSDKLSKLKVKYIMVDYKTGNEIIPIMNGWIGNHNYENTFAQKLYNDNGEGLNVKLVYESTPIVENNIVKTVKIFEFNGLK